MANNGVANPFQAELQERPHMSIDPSNRCFRIWKAVTITVAAYVVVISSYLFGFAPVVSQVHNRIDLLTCMLFIIDIGVCFFATYIDNTTNTNVRTWDRRFKIYLISLGSIRLIGVIPALLFPDHVIKYLYITRVFHIVEVFKAISYLKMNHHTKINAGLKWARIVFVILFSIHFMGCIFYFIGIRNPSPTWIDLGDAQMKNEKHKDFFTYMMSMYWSTAVFTTVGFGDYHAVTGLEMVFSIISMLFYMLLNSYISSIMSELLQGTHQRTKFREDSESLRKLVRNHQLQDGLHQEMYNFLIKTRDNQLAKPFDIQTLFPDGIQFRVKQEFSQQIRNSYLFNEVSIPLMHLLVSEMKLEIFEPNETVLLANAYSKKIYVLVQGVGGGIEGTGGLNLQLSVCGEFGVVCGLPQPHDVRTTNHRTTLLSLSRKRFYRLMGSNKQDAQRIASNLLENLAGEGGDPDILRQVDGKFNRGEINLHVDIRFACQRSYTNLLLHLIKSGEDVEQVYAQQRNILHIVIEEEREGYEGCVKILLREMTLSSINQRDTSGETPLLCAIRKRLGLVIYLFQQRGVTLEHDKVVGYYTKAIEETDEDLLNYIKDLGGDINVQDKVSKKAPIHLAVRKKNVAMVKTLIALGADIDLVDANGISARSYAVEHDGYEDILALFKV